MAKWARGSGGGRRGRWVIEFVPKVDGVDVVDGVAAAPVDADPFSYERAEDIVAALWRFEQRKMLTVGASIPE